MFLHSSISYDFCCMLSNDPVVQVGKRQGEREDFVGWRNAASGLLESSPLYHASPEDASATLGDFFMEISLVAHLRRELEGNPSGKCKRRVPAFQDMPREGYFLWVWVSLKLSRVMV